MHSEDPTSNPDSGLKFLDESWEVLISYPKFCVWEMGTSETISWGWRRWGLYRNNTSKNTYTNVSLARIIWFNLLTALLNWCSFPSSTGAVFPGLCAWRSLRGLHPLRWALLLWVCQLLRIPLVYSYPCPVLHVTLWESREGPSQTIGKERFFVCLVQLWFWWQVLFCSCLCPFRITHHGDFRVIND